MEKILDGKRIAVLATDGFEQSELFLPLRALKKAGAEVDIVSLKKGKIRSWDKKDWGKTIDVDATTDNADPTDYDGLLLPGGVMNPDSLRANPKAVEFVKSFVTEHKPIAAICHGPWTLIEAGAVKDRRMTSWPSLKTDLENAGAMWIDQEVIVDRGLVTSRKPEDLNAFTEKMIEEFGEGVQMDDQSRASGEGMPEPRRIYNSMK
jgi:protease I